MVLHKNLFVCWGTLMSMICVQCATIKYDVSLPGVQFYYTLRGITESDFSDFDYHPWIFNLSLDDRYSSSDDFFDPIYEITDEIKLRELEQLTPDTNGYFRDPVSFS